MNPTDQPIAKKDLETALAVFGVQLANTIVTQLRGEMKTMERNLRSDMQAMEGGIRGDMQTMESGLRGEMKVMENGLRKDMKTMEERIVENLRDEFTSKLAATNNRMATMETSLKRHTETVVAEHSGEVLQAIANVVEPLQMTIKDHGRRIRHLEHKAA